MLRPLLLLALALQLASLAPLAAGTRLYLLPLASHLYPEAVCNDGSSAGYYVRPGFSADYVIFLQGGASPPPAALFPPPAARRPLRPSGAPARPRGSAFSPPLSPACAAPSHSLAPLLAPPRPAPPRTAPPHPIPLLRFPPPRRLLVLGRGELRGSARGPHVERRLALDARPRRALCEQRREAGEG
jgi:hypothetical protein